MEVVETVATIFQHLPDQLKMQQRYRPNAQPVLNVGGGGYGGGGNCGNNLPAPSRPAQNAAAVQTECPAGSKCVAEDFCDANGRMSRSRVSLSNWEKEQR